MRRASKHHRADHLRNGRPNAGRFGIGRLEFRERALEKEIPPGPRLTRVGQSGSYEFEELWRRWDGLHIELTNSAKVAVFAIDKPDDRGRDGYLDDRLEEHDRNWNRTAESR
jgi:hypothetical protein